MGEPDEFAGRQVTVMGLGRFGGGVGVTRFLADRGADVLVTDLDDAEKLAKSIEQIQDLVDSGRVTLRLGGHNVSDFTTRGLVVVNPAVKPGNRFVRAAEAAGIEVTTEMRLLVQRLPNRLRTIGVTGSAGKSTVTAMIGHVLGKVLGSDPNTQHPAPKPRLWVGGNIGVSLLPVLDQIGEDDWVVLELSSFMLERLKQDDHFAGWSPHIAVITNISPNHLDWHGSMQAYCDAKLAMFRSQDLENDVRIYGPTIRNPIRRQLRLGFSGSLQTPLMGFVFGRIRDSLIIPGKHNWHNAIIAIMAAARASGLEVTDIPDHLADFPGLPHRLQPVAEHDGVRYFNDSKCTTPEAAVLAVEVFAEDADKPGGLPGIHLILGGKDKGSDMGPLAALASEKCKAVYTIGALGDTLAALIEDAAGRSVPDRPTTCGGVGWPAETAEAVRCGDLDTAVNEIRQRVKPGDVVLLSPACASWDQFENYEQRGQRFVELVSEITPRS